MCSSDDYPPYERPVPKVTKPAIHEVSRGPSDGLTQAELLDLFDRTAMYPELRAAIRNILTPR